jgi:hypothetical protein
MYRIWDSAVGTATGYGMDGRGCIPGRCKFFTLHSVQTGSGANPTSCPMGIGDYFPGVQRPLRVTDHSPPSNAEVKNVGPVPLLPHTSSWYNELLIKNSDDWDM